MIQKLCSLFILIILATGCGGGTSGTASGDTTVRAFLSSSTDQASDITIQSLSSSQVIAVGSSGEIIASRIEEVIPIIITRRCNCPAGEVKDVFNLDGIKSSVSLISLGITLNGNDSPKIEIMEVQ